ncbi:hypothetical protein [Micromonospora sp. SH-82]|uniref:hypothetical protein n=1 Tax=Micromonospora sp. SH-82 TaxID=3132938 RepID=UPI003EBB24E1
MARRAEARAHGERRRWSTVVTLTFVVVATTACGAEPGDGVRVPSVSGPVYPTPSVEVPSDESSREQPGGDDHRVDPVRTPPAGEAPRVVVAFAAAWVRSDLSAGQWWEGVADSCDPDFAQTLRTVDPEQVPATRVTGRPVARTKPTDGRAVYDVPTDSGTLTVRVAAVDGRWRVTGNDFVRTVR